MERDWVHNSTSKYRDQTRLDHTIEFDMSVLIPFQAYAHRFPGTGEENFWHTGVDPVDTWFQSTLCLLLFCFYWWCLRRNWGYGFCLICVEPSWLIFFADRFMVLVDSHGSVLSSSSSSLLSF
ncbi:hypothetical protein BDV28DRAFT_100517 [Aspergillus coremiiformis]|uniref:Uncharacterized protein n=1 Tax=Aspergillus coremiiformis TaxID=138285 RepID=A0A5N6Z7Y8_9EURO|nr:hypothetical protein BDV28DRAFT_100517 [Aspergillus coremiiformis]